MDREKGVIRVEDLFSNERFDVIYDQLGGDSYEKFVFQNSRGTICHNFIKREIPTKIGGSTYYCLAAPFAYGGPVITKCAERDKTRLVKEFSRAFEAYCIENFIVYETVRFHPIVGNVKDFAACYESVYREEGYGVNLAAFSEPTQEEFSTSCLKSIWRAVKAGVKYRVTDQPESLRDYIQYYAEHTKKNETDFKYFLECGRVAKKNLVLVEAVYDKQVIGMSLNFLLDDVIQTHLAITHPKFNQLSPAHIMHFGLAIWGKENGMSLIYDGGRIVIDGKTHNLPIHKQQFSKYTSFQLWNGRRIWDKAAYQKLREVGKIGEWAE